MASSFIRSHDFDLGNDKIRFTVQTDINNILSNRRRQLSQKIGELSSEKFRDFASSWHNTVKDKLFHSVNRDCNDDIIKFIITLGGEIMITRNVNSSKYDYFMNVMFN